MNCQITQRQPIFDNMKGLLIFFVVFAHCLYDFQNDIVIETIVKSIYLFHMPAFIFLSGFFGKSQNAQKTDSLVRLFFAYIIFNSILGMIMGYSNVIIPVYSYWYLLALILWRATAKYAAKYRFAFPIAVILGLAVGFVSKIDNILALSRFFAFYPFYLAGYLLEEEQLKKLIPSENSKRIQTGFLAFIVTAIVAYVALERLLCPLGSMLMDPYGIPFDVVYRIFIWLAAFTAILTLLHLMPNRNIPLLTMIGRNSLSVFLLHRGLALLFSEKMPNTANYYIIAAAFVVSAVICLLFGNDRIGRLVSNYLRCGGDALLGKKSSGNKALFLVSKVSVFAVVGAMILTSVIEKYPIRKDSSQEENGSADVIYNTLSREQEQQFEDAFKIVFSGDLILLEDQVKRGYRDGAYDFSDVFEFAGPYIRSADFAIGVFEGPTAGAEAGYSTSNYDDGKELALNFPDEFAAAVKDAGFDLVTTANNHLLDKGVEGACRTLDVLDSIQLDHTGSYRSEEEKENNRVKIVEIDNLRFAILSYTYGANGLTTEELTSSEYGYITSVISGTEGPMFEQLKEAVMKDFEAAKAYEPDFILVLPHIGTQFLNEPDEEQKAWFQVFKDCGADIILGDHSHSVQPVSISENGGKKVFEAYCPGNFANIYREHQGDSSALIEIYIDRTNKEIIGGGIIPLYTQAQLNTNYRAIPIFEIENNKSLRAALSTDDYKRAEKAHTIITTVMLGNAMDITSVTPSYRFNESGFLRQTTGGLEMTEKYENGVLNKAILNADSVCFLGDSLTEGTKNGGCPWYEPLCELYSNKTFLNYSKGGCTISYLNSQAKDIPKADLYIIAIGTNDVRYRDPSKCAMTPQDFSGEMERLRASLAEKNPSAQFIWIAPWYSTDGDPYTTLSYQEKLDLNEAYSKELESFALSHGDGSININRDLQDFFEKNPCGDYLLDHIHPNAKKGVLLYSDLVLRAK